MSEDDPRAKGGGRVAGKIAIVVGGGTTSDDPTSDFPGTGSAMCRLFAAQGARVAVVGRTAAHTDRTVDMIEREGGTAVALLADASNEDDCRRVIGDVVERWGGIDIVVNNLGMTGATTVAEFDREIWDRTLAVNLTSVVFMAKLALPHLRRRDTSSIINIGSVGGLQAAGPVPGGAALPYVMTKGSLVVLTRELAAELGQYGVRVNIIVPGHLQTPIAGRSGAVVGNEDLRVQLTMLGIPGTAWDVAWAALFLASDESRYITSVVLPVDGGVTESLMYNKFLRLQDAGFIRV
jgi:NAD(P)-dependent dehydrogenase (short-subunit alcohol dehydrogenase family)